MSKEKRRELLQTLIFITSASTVFSIAIILCSVWMLIESKVSDKRVINILYISIFNFVISRISMNALSKLYRDEN